MVVKELEVKLKAGLQARSAAELVQKSSQFSSDIYLEKDGRKVNAKSIMGLMSLAVGPGSSIKLIAQGDDEDEAIASVASYMENEG